VLAAMGKKLFRAGKLGSGHAAKSINNYLGATNLIAIAEGLIAGTKFGLDPANLLAIINASTGNSGTSQGLYPGQVLNRKFGAGFALALMAKDVGLAADLAKDVGMNAEVMAHTAKVWAKARETLKGNPDFTEIVKMFEAENGVELVKKYEETRHALQGRQSAPESGRRRHADGRLHAQILGAGVAQRRPRGRRRSAEDTIARRGYGRVPRP